MWQIKVRTLAAVQGLQQACWVVAAKAQHPWRDEGSTPAAQARSWGDKRRLGARSLGDMWETT